MRLLLTADLHYNHGKSKSLAEDLIKRMNQAGGDALVVVGDTASGAPEVLEQCLSLFQFSGPKLFVAGNHELWTYTGDTYELFHTQLPARVRQLGWHWLQDDPFIAGDLAIVGSVGWYDFSFARASLGIPKRFYASKVSPGAALRFDELAHLFNPDDDIAPHAREVIARWNDGRYVRLGRSDEQFLEELIDQLRHQLDGLRKCRQVLAAVHHLPFRELLPPPHSPQWDFAKAFLGSERIGQLLQEFPNISHVYCGHSHLPCRATIGPIQTINIGSGYRWKTFETLDL